MVGVGTGSNKVLNYYYKSATPVKVILTLTGTLGNDPQMRLDAIALAENTQTIIPNPVVSQTDTNISVDARVIHQANATEAKKVAVTVYEKDGSKKTSGTADIEAGSDTITHLDVALARDFTGKMEIQVLDAFGKAIGRTFTYQLPMADLDDSGLIGHYTAKKLVKEKNAILLDVRSKEEFAASNIKGSLNIPLADLALKGKDVLDYAEIDKEDTIIVEESHESYTPDRTKVTPPEEGIKKDHNSKGEDMIINGHKFDKGIAAHAPSTVTYHIPQGMNRFVAVAGVDDTAGNRTKEYTFDIAIPEGAKKLQLVAKKGNSSLHSGNNMFTEWGYARFLKDPDYKGNDPTGANLALEKPVIATANQDSSYSAEKAVDGKADVSMWSIAELPQAIQVDLGAVYELDTISTYRYGANSNYTYNIYLTDKPAIEAKDGKNTLKEDVVPIVAKLTGVGFGEGENLFRTNYNFLGRARGRYLTINVTGAFGSDLSALWEIEAYGTKVGESEEELADLAPLMAGYELYTVIKEAEKCVEIVTESEKEIADKLGITTELAKEINKVAEEYQIPNDTLYITQKSITSTKSDKDIKGSSFAAIQAKAAKQSKDSIKLSWNKVKGADGYLVFSAKCGGKKYTLKKNITKAKTTSYTHKGLKKNSYYKFIVVAYKKVGTAKVTLAASKTIHETVKGGRYGYIKSVSAKKSSIQLSRKKTYKLGANMKKSGKKTASHRGIKYESGNSKIASVNSKGKITAKKKGKCYVYAYAQNGVFKKVKVTVR